MESVVEQAVLQVAQQMENDVDQQLHNLDNMGEDELERIRQARMADLKKHADKKQKWLNSGHGEYISIQNEKEFFSLMKGEERMICHFYRENWPCKVMDKHLNVLCKKHIETKFCKIDAEKSQYLTEKLHIWMLPTLALVQLEKVIGYVVGFDELGGSDDFHTETLARRLAADNMVFLRDDTLQPPNGKEPSIKKSELSRTADDEDSDFD